VRERITSVPQLIYNLFMVRRWTERWLRLTPDAQDALSGQITAALNAAGGRRIIMCESSWCDEGYRGWGVEEFPDLAAWRRFAVAREKLEWYSYLEGRSLLGTWHQSINPAEAVAPEPGKIYQLALIRRFTETHGRLTPAQREALAAKEGATRASAKWIVAANSYWANEEYGFFGVFMWSDVAAVQRHFANLEQLNWPNYVRAQGLLGTLWGERP
jgi:hypothetical protein